jgi:hypothetical protein
MAKNKTSSTEVSIATFLENYVTDEQKKNESLQLVALMQQWSGQPAKMWGPSIIGFGTYHYKYESGHEGDAPLIGFSPRKAEFSLYVYVPTSANDVLLQKLGKYKMGKACIYIKKLGDIDLSVLEQIARGSIRFIQQQYYSAN